MLKNRAFIVIAASCRRLHKHALAICLKILFIDLSSDLGADYLDLSGKRLDYLRLIDQLQMGLSASLQM